MNKHYSILTRLKNLNINHGLQETDLSSCIYQNNIVYILLHLLQLLLISNSMNESFFKLATKCMLHTHYMYNAHITVHTARSCMHAHDNLCDVKHWMYKKLNWQRVANFKQHTFNVKFELITA